MSIYCNSKPSTRHGDHIPPQSFFKKARGIQLIQVPCCQECNQKVSFADRQVRNFLVALHENSSHPILTEELHATVSRDLVDHGGSQQFFSHFVDIETMKKSNEKMTENDFKELDEQLQTDYLVQEFGERMIRALLLNDHGIRITLPFQRKVRLLSQWKLEGTTDSMKIFESFQNLKQLIPSNTLDGDAFRWITYLEKPNGIAACWIQFYGGTEIGIILATEQIIEVSKNRT